MNRIVVILIAGLVSSGCFAGDNLFRLDASDLPAENGKKLDMSFSEVARHAEDSEVEVRLVHGGSVSSSMFTLRGMCGLARARNEAFFKTESLAGPPGHYRVVFPKAAPPETVRPANPADKIWSVAECSLLQF